MGALILQFKSSHVAVRTMFLVANTAVWKNWCTRCLSSILLRCHNLLVWVKSVLHEHISSCCCNLQVVHWVCTWFGISPTSPWHHPLFTLSRQTDWIYPHKIPARLSCPSLCQTQTRPSANQVRHAGRLSFVERLTIHFLRRACCLGGVGEVCSNLKVHHDEVD